MPPRGTPRRHAFEQIFKGHKPQPKVSVETTSMEVYRALLSTSDRLSLFSSRDVQEYGDAGLEALPYRSTQFKRDDGIAVRKDWKPTRMHLEFIERLNTLAGVDPAR
jgi:DNA-binding transcriptional LysR family regulator